MNIKQKSNRFRSIVNEMADLYEKKNSNYGDSFGQLFEELGPTAGLVPLWNKLHRATSLIKGNKNNFESLEDTFKDLACYAIMNLIEMEAQRKTDISEDTNGGAGPAELPEYIECEVYELHQTPNISFITADCYGCKHTNCPYYKSYINLCGVGGESIKTVYKSTDPCEGCPTKELLQTGSPYVGDLPCQWCSKNPLRFQCIDGATNVITITNDQTFTTHTLNDRKGDLNDAKEKNTSIFSR